MITLMSLNKTNSASFAFVASRHSLAPTLTALAVCSLLSKFGTLFVDAAFTADMEAKLDDMANDCGADRAAFLADYHRQLQDLVDSVLEAPESEVRKASLPALENEDVQLLIGSWGPYIQRALTLPHDKEGSDEVVYQTAQLPVELATNWTRITPSYLNKLLDLKHVEQPPLGIDPDSKLPLHYKVARYGPYLQLGEKGGEGYKTQSIPEKYVKQKDLDGDDEDFKLSCPIDFDEALQYIRLPRFVGTHNDTDVYSGLGRYGPYIKFNNTYATLPGDLHILSVDIDQAGELVEKTIQMKNNKLGRGVLANLGEMKGSDVTVREGRYGRYLNWNKVNAKLPLKYFESPSEIPMEVAWNAIQEKMATMPASERVKKGKSKRAKSKVALPPAPKRPLSAYLHFCAEMRPTVKDTSTKLGDISKELARLWAETSDRSKWDELAKASKAEYADKKEKWQAECDALMPTAESSNTTESKAKPGGVDSLVNLPPAPKRPLSAYFHFMAEMRPQVKEKASSMAEIAKEIGRLWSEVDDKSKWERLAEAGKMQYEEDKIKWRDECNRLMGGGEFLKKTKNETKSKSKQASKRNVGASRKSASRRNASKSTKRAPSAYMLFCSDNRLKIVDELMAASGGIKPGLGAVTKELAKQWNECQDESREKYAEIAAEEKRKLLEIA